jgi:hypothetical protein
MKKIIVEIKPDGEAIVEVEGSRGPLCLKESGWLEKLLGKVKKRSYKKEYTDKAYILEKV